MQYVGKLMRNLEPETLQAIRDALDEQHSGSAQQTLALHMAEKWRDDLIASDDALQNLAAGASRHRRAAAARPGPPGAQGRRRPGRNLRGLAPRRGRAYREIFQLVREQPGGARR
jgi:ribosome-associated protein